MQAVILAAGMGKRLGKKTQGHTKGMVDIMGRSFLERSLDLLYTTTRLTRIVLVVGYEAQEVKNRIGTRWKEVNVEYVENKDYEKTNNIYSLWLAKDYLELEDTLLLESDLIFEKSILQRLLESPDPNLAVVDKYQPYMDGTVVKMNKRGEMTALISKAHFDFSEINSYYKTVNIYKFSREFLRDQYLPFLGAYITAVGKHSYYEQILKVLLTLEKRDIKLLTLHGEKWYEVDTLQDLRVAEEMLCNEGEQKLTRISARYGGYWRFPRMKDFCYPVNPYFPPQRMLDEARQSYESLLRNYPSGRGEIDALAAEIYGLEVEQIVVGNGAAELIAALLSEPGWGKVGLTLPTSQEYSARIMDPNSVLCFHPTGNAENPFSYDIQHLLSICDSVDSPILINPDNPSGNFIAVDDVLRLIDYFYSKGKRILLDESFVDFSSEGEANSLLREQILSKYPNLVIVKSISKSYGVPGLRLGIVASSDIQLIQRCKEKLPVWNVNSFAEFFLQTFPKYRTDYRDACHRLAQARESLIIELAKSSILQPLPSQANYILCKVLPPWIPSRLAQQLLLSDFFIKDCSGKLGMKNSPYVRIAVRSEEENAELVRVLNGFSSGEHYNLPSHES